ncbi:Peptide deformylase [Candidatus Hodgkinia cicadicola]|nr:Peptide deformylase [Candidatus Hodgkinia cicadicola]
MVGKAQSCQECVRAFESACSLLIYPDPRLRLRALTQPTHAMLACVNRLAVTALALDGCGINSVQIGQPIGVILTSGYQMWTRARMLLFSLVRIVELGRTFVCALEGCLSLSKVFKRTSRHNTIVVICVNITSARVRAFKTQGLLATCCQHELDHNNASLIIDT